jgi:hypothetical protein
MNFEEKWCGKCVWEVCRLIVNTTMTACHRNLDLANFQFLVQSILEVVYKQNFENPEFVFMTFQSRMLCDKFVHTIFYVQQGILIYVCNGSHLLRATLTILCETLIETLTYPMFILLMA